jgi:rhodanese-related sulfurtransferase
VKKDREVVIYRGVGAVGGSDRDAANASAMAVTWGFKVYYFPDGVDVWKKAGHPVEKL